MMTLRPFVAPTDAPPPSAPPDLLVWRQRMLDGLLRGTFGVGALALIGGSISVIQNSPPSGATRALLLVGAFLLAYAGLGIVTFIRTLGFAIRAGVLLTVLYSVGVLSFAQYGLSGDGSVFLIAFSTLAAMLFGVRGGSAALTGSLTTMLVIAGTLVTGYHTIPVSVQANSTKANAWVSTTLIVLMLASAIMIALLYLLRQLTAALQTERRLRETEARARQAEDQVQTAAEEMRQHQEIETQLRALVAALETPVVRLADGVLLAPIVGPIDAQRAEALINHLLHTVHAQHVHQVVVDIHGVTTTTITAAQALVQLAQALKLLGCEMVVTGMSAAFAQTLSSDQVPLNGLQTALSPQEVLARFR